jgi:hypothetical protein
MGQWAAGAQQEDARIHLTLSEFGVQDLAR